METTSPNVVIKILIMEIIYLIIGIVVGTILGWFIGRRGNSSSITEIEVLKSKLEQREQSFSELLRNKEQAYAESLKEKEEAAAKNLELQRESAKAAAEVQERHFKESQEAMQSRFDETIAKMQAELEGVTARMLKERQSEFETASRKQMSSIVDPLNDTIKQMKESVEKNTAHNNTLQGQLSENIKQVISQSEAARKSADNLASALRSGSKVQGNWGETVLTELLESQGLREGIHFETQGVLREADGSAVVSDENRQLRPDVILHLDKQRDVIIDAKVSLSAYLDYMNAETEEARRNALRAHVASVEKHVAELARKNYAAYVKPPKETVNYVIMFVPNTTALYAATNEKPELWRRAMEQNVYIADEQTLYAALKIIDLTWRQIAQAENHERVYELADEMLKRVGMFMQKFMEIGKSLESATKAYEGGLAKLSESGQSIPQTCRKLVKLGASSQSRKGVPDELLGLGNDA